MKTFNPKEFTKGAIAEVIPCGYDDVKFEGILCSASINADTSERAYFTVDSTGKALSAFEPTCLTSLAFNIKMKNVEVQTISTPSTQLMPNGKPRIVEVVRFFRAFDYDVTQISNFGGMTAICVMDHALEQIRVYPAFCHPEDNFSKILGLEIARTNQAAGNGFVISMIDDVPLRNTLEFAFWNDDITWLNLESKRAFTKALERFINE